MKGLVGLVGWPIADGLPTSGYPSAAGRAQDRKVRRPKTDVLPLCHATRLPEKVTDDEVETILYTVLKFPFNHHCFQGGELNANFGGKLE